MAINQWADLDEKPYQGNQGDSKKWNAVFQENIWDTCIIGDYQLPGKCFCQVAVGKKRKLDNVPIKGKKNAQKSVDSGYDPAEGAVEVTIWTADQYAELVRVLGILLPKPTEPTLGSYPIISVNTAFLGINEITITGVTGFDDGPLPKKVTINFFEFIPKKEEAAGSTITKQEELKDRKVAQGADAVKKNAQQEAARKPASDKPTNPSQRLPVGA